MAPRPSYRQAIHWIVENDDTEFVNDEQPLISVAASLVADLFNKTDQQIIADIKKILSKQQEKDNGL